VPRFCSTANILVDPKVGEEFDPNWMDSDKLILPKNKKWDYKRPMKLEDVNLWEIIYEASYGQGVYAAWDPYAEFYLITTGWDWDLKPWQKTNTRFYETYYGPDYGPNIIEIVHKRCKELKYPIKLGKTWVDDEDMWLYKKEKEKKIIKY